MSAFPCPFISSDLLFRVLGIISLSAERKSCLRYFVQTVVTYSTTRNLIEQEQFSTRGLASKMSSSPPDGRKRQRHYSFPAVGGHEDIESIDRKDNRVMKR